MAFFTLVKDANDMDVYYKGDFVACLRRCVGSGRNGYEAVHWLDGDACEFFFEVAFKNEHDEFRPPERHEWAKMYSDMCMNLLESMLDRGMIQLYRISAIKPAKPVKPAKPAKP